jgi:hypothetical protein
MTTIIARNKELVADRRKIVNYRKLGVIGVRDAPKIHKEPFCLYGIAGFELTEEITDFGMSKELMLRRLAALFALSYYTESSEKKALLYELPGASKTMIDGMMEAWRGLRNIIGNQVAREFESFSQSLIAMGRFNTLHFINGEFLTMPNTEIALLGSGVKTAAVLLDHGYTYDQLYPALRRAGIPTGETYDKLTVADDLPDLMPPISHPMLLRTIAILMKKSISWEIKEGILTKEGAHAPRRALAENLATFLSLGNTNSSNRWVFSKKPIWFWDTPKLRSHRHYRLACHIVGIEPEEKKEESKS